MRTKLRTAMAMNASILAVAAAFSAQAQTLPVSDAIEEVVVTTRRTAERLQDVPLAVTAQTANQLAERNITDLQGVARYTPSLQFKDYVTAFHGNATIRGLSQANVQNAVGNVGTFIDGIYLQRGFLVNTSLGDWDRIEVVKGPQSALYGANTFSGAINYVTKAPGDEWAGEAQATYGNYASSRVTGAIGGPIVDGILSARLFGGYARSDGTWRNNLPDASGRNAHLGGYSRDAFSGALKFTPADGVQASLYYTEVRRTEYLRAYYEVDGTFVEDRLNCGPLNATTRRPSMYCGTFPADPNSLRSGVGARPADPFSVEQPGTKTTTKLLRGTVDYQITPAIAVHYLYGMVRGQAIEDLSFASNTYNPTGKAVISQQHEGGKIRYSSHELRVGWDDGGSIKGEIGYFHSAARDRFTFGIRLVPPGRTLTRLSDDPLNMTGIIGYTNTDASYDIDAVFARASYAFLDGNAKISAEGRFSETSIAFNDLLARANNPALSPLKSTYKDFVPRLTAEYHFTPTNMLYASAAKGVKTGGFNGYVSGSTTLTTDEQSFGQEKNWTYEIGSKNTFLGGRLLMNAGLFYVDWTNKQAAAIPSRYDRANIVLGQTPPSIYRAIGNAESYGFEITGLYRPIAPLTINYSASWTHATYTPGSLAVNYIGLCDDVICKSNGDISGKRIEGAPTLSAAIGAEWRDVLWGDWSYFTGADLTWQNEQYADPENLTRIDSYTLVDARLGVENDRWKVWFWGKNIFDRKYVQNAFVIPSLRQYAPSYGDRATYGISARVSF
jgi:iron complex outermembrane recepter protein